MTINNDSNKFWSTSGKTSSAKSRQEGVTIGRGIAALPLTYVPHKQHVEKGKAIIEFEREGSCSICSQDLIHDRGIYAICPHPGCESVSHLTCLSKSFLEGETGEHGSNRELSVTDRGPALVPMIGKCKCCGRAMKWLDVVKEVTLRMRGVKEVEGLLKEPRKKALKKPAMCKGKLKGTTTEIHAITSSDTDEGSVDDPDHDAAEDLDDPRDEDLHDGREEFDVTRDDSRFATVERPIDVQEEWLVIDDSNDDLESVTDSLYGSPGRIEQARRMAMDPSIDGTEWDNVLVLD
jgi:structure-specific endonuclease subunit SLX1